MDALRSEGIPSQKKDMEQFKIIQSKPIRNLKCEQLKNTPKRLLILHKININ